MLIIQKLGAFLNACKRISAGTNGSQPVNLASSCTGSSADHLPPTESSHHMFALTYKNTRYQHHNTTSPPPRREISILQALKSQNVLSQGMVKCWQFQLATEGVTLPVLRLPATRTTLRSDSGPYRPRCNCHVCQLFIQRKLFMDVPGVSERLMWRREGSDLCRFSEGS